MKKFIARWLTNTLAVLVAVHVVPGLRFKDNNFWTPFVIALVLGILNTFIRPVLMFFALPLLIFTLGLFTLVINGLLLYLVSVLLSRSFEIDGFWPAFWGALVISVVTALLNMLIGAGGTRVRFEHRQRPPDSDGGGGGPVIDI